MRQLRAPSRKEAPPSLTVAARYRRLGHSPASSVARDERLLQGDDDLRVDRYLIASSSGTDDPGPAS